MAETLEPVAAPFWAAVRRIATPLMLGTLGVLQCERAGLLYLCIEGIRVAGAFAGWPMVDQGSRLWPASPSRRRWGRPSGCCSRR